MSVLGSLGSIFNSKEEGEEELDFEIDDENLEFTLSDEKDVKITKKIEKLADVDVKYPLIKPFAYAHVKWNEEEKEVIYQVIEPELDKEEQRLLELFKNNLSEKIDVSLSSMGGRKKIIGYLQNQIDDLIIELGVEMTDQQHKKILYYIYRDFVGLGKVEAFMHDPYIEDLGCLSRDEMVFARVEGEVRYVEAGELVEKYIEEGEDTLKKNVENLELISFDEEGKTCFKPVKSVLRRKNYCNKKYRIKTVGNNKIEVSPDHPVLTITPDGIKEKRAENISEEDYLLRAKNIGIDLESETEIDLIEELEKLGKTDWRVKGAAELIDDNRKVGELLGVSNRKIANWKSRDSIPVWAYTTLEEENDSDMREEIEINPGQGSYYSINPLIEIDGRLAKLIGYFIAEGFYESPGIGFAFNKKEKKYHEEVKEILEEKFDARVTVRDRQKFDTTHIHCGGKIFETLFRDILKLGNDCYDKRVPQEAFTWGDELTEKLLKGYVNGEGYARISEKTNKAVIPTASKKLADEIRLLFYKLGIQTAIDKRSRKHANTWEVRLENGSNLRNYIEKFDKDAETQLKERRASNSELYPHFISRKEDFKGTDRKYWNRAEREKGRLSEQIVKQSEKAREVIDSDYHPVPVREIEIIDYREPFYDFEMEEEPNFMHGEFIFTHNCDGVGTPIFAVHSEFGSVKSNVVYDDEEELENVVIKLAERCDRYVSYANPLLDGSLPDGSRVNASLTEDVTSHGPTFSIRKFQETPFSAVDMMDLGTANARIMAYMWILQQYQQSILICGGTATGKTSFLNATVSFIPPEDKIVSIEDTRELQLPHENWIPSVTREMFGTDSQGDVDMDQLLKESFRQNPDYVVVGEVRGEEASVLFQGMSSGHPSIGTMHASSPNAVVKRLITPPISLSPALIEAIDAIVIMTHAKGVEKSARRVKSVHELQKVVGESASARTNQPFSWTAIDDSFQQRGDPYLFDQISKNYGVSKQNLKEELDRRESLLKWLKEKGVKDFEEVSDIIAEYYKNKEEILKMINSEEEEYSLDDVISAESKVNLSRPERLEKAMDNEVEEGKLEQEINEITGDHEIDKKKRIEENPVAELEKQLKAERKKVENIRSKSVDDIENPFQDDEKIEGNPFEA